MFTEAYLEPRRTSKIELFCENSEKIAAVNYFCKKLPHRCLTGCSSFVFENENNTLKNIRLIISRDLHSFLNNNCITPLVKDHLCNTTCIRPLNEGKFKIKSN